MYKRSVKRGLIGRRPARKKRKTQTAARSAGAPDTRTRVLQAARELAAEQGFSGLTVEKVADRAGVARLTIYYQFGSKQELLEALFDHVAESGQLSARLPVAFANPDALEALDDFIGAFCTFWSSDRVGLRRLRGWTQVDTALESQGRIRDGWRYEGLKVLVSRLREQYQVPAESEVAGLVEVLHTLTSFESYDNLLSNGRTPAEVETLLKQTMRTLIGLP